jgi:hypothetical protein
MNRISAQMKLLTACLISFFIFLCPACHKPNPAPPPTPSEQQKRAELAAEMPASLQKQWTFLNRLRQSDRYSDIDRTLVNHQGELGVVLSSNIHSGEIESLLQEVMKKMAKEFPGEDIVLNAYESTQPLHKLGRAQLDGKTEEITYLGAR